MATSSSSFETEEGGFGLPTPVVRLAANRAGSDYTVANGSPSSNTVTAVLSQNVASVSVHGLPQAIMDDLAKFQPQLELMRYVNRRTSSTSFSRNFQNSGYVHPANGPAPSGDGSHTHGGGIGNFSAVNAIRPTEWLVSDWGQVIDVTQGMHGFMQLGRVVYLDSAGNGQLIQAVYPSGSNVNRNFGARFPYQGIFKPGYFKFRWSIIDPTDDRGQRITGPLSDTVSLTSNVFPFDPAPIVSNRSTATVAPNYQPLETRMWIGSVSRLPR